MEPIYQAIITTAIVCGVGIVFNEVSVSKLISKMRDRKYRKMQTKNQNEKRK